MNNLRDILYETIHPKSSLKNCIFVVLVVLHFGWLHFPCSWIKPLVLNFPFSSWDMEESQKKNFPRAAFLAFRFSTCINSSYLGKAHLASISQSARQSPGQDKQVLAERKTSKQPKAHM